NPVAHTMPRRESSPVDAPVRPCPADPTGAGKPADVDWPVLTGAAATCSYTSPAVGGRDKDVEILALRQSSGANFTPVSAELALQWTRPDMTTPCISKPTSRGRGVRRAGRKARSRRALPGSSRPTRGPGRRNPRRRRYPDRPLRRSGPENE